MRQIDLDEKLKAIECAACDPEVDPQSSPWYLRELNETEFEFASRLFDFVPDPPKPPLPGLSWSTYRQPRELFECRPLPVPTPDPTPKARPKKVKEETLFPFQPPQRKPRFQTFTLDDPPIIEGFPCTLCGTSWVGSTRLYPNHHIRFALRSTAIFPRVVQALIRNKFLKADVGVYVKWEKHRQMRVKTLSCPRSSAYFWIECDLLLL